MFQGNAEQALQLYTSVIPGSKIVDLQRYDARVPEAEGLVFRATFTVGDQTVLCTDSFIKHDFTFTPSFSFWVECVSEAQQDELFAKLSEGGSVAMPMAEYPFSRRFAWIVDRFGVSWQLNLA
jgi:predicted 3-demethylubiquinone-9 3-methyltransferase (glyoxalase superfamily)